MALYFSTLEQWNTLHMAAASAYSCLAHPDCKVQIGAAPDSLDVLFHHICKKHPEVYNDGEWTGIAALADRGTRVGVNPGYWPPENHIGDLW